MEHYASNNLEKKEKKKDEVASASVKEYVAQVEKEFSLASFDSSVGSSSFHDTWIIDSGSTRHMTGLYGVFQNITRLGFGHFIETNIGSPHATMQGVGIVRFELEFDEFLEVDDVLSVLGIRVIRLLVSSLKE